MGTCVGGYHAVAQARLPYRYDQGSLDTANCCGALICDTSNWSSIYANIPLHTKECELLHAL